MIGQVDLDYTVRPIQPTPVCLFKWFYKPIYKTAIRISPKLCRFYMHFFTLDTKQRIINITSNANGSATQST